MEENFLTLLAAKNRAASLGTFRVRESLGISAALRAWVPYTRPRPKISEPVLDTGWAEKRLEELKKAGINAVIQRPKKEPPCVVYRLPSGTAV